MKAILIARADADQYGQSIRLLLVRLFWSINLRVSDSARIFHMLNRLLVGYGLGSNHDKNAGPSILILIFP